MYIQGALEKEWHKILVNISNSTDSVFSIKKGTPTKITLKAIFFFFLIAC